MRFYAHLEILKATLCQHKKVGLNKVWVPTLFLAIDFDLHRFLFVLTMKNNAKLAMQKPFDLNPLTKFWRSLSSSRIFEHKILEYIKLVELLVVQVIGLVEDEQCFSKLTIMKTKLRNQLTVHLELVIQMFSQKFFTIKTSLLEQQFKVGKTTKFVMGNDERFTEFYNCTLFPQSILV